MELATTRAGGCGFISKNPLKSWPSAGRASAAESLFPFLPSPSSLLFQLCTDVDIDWQCGSLSAPHWHFLSPFLPIPPVMCFSKQQVVLSPSTLDSALTFPVQLFIFCLTVEARSCANIFQLQFMFGAKRISWSRGLMMIHTFLFKKTRLCLEIPLKCLNESEENCIREFSSLFLVKGICAVDHLAGLASWDFLDPLDISRLENQCCSALNLRSSLKQQVESLFPHKLGCKPCFNTAWGWWPWALFPCVDFLAEFTP